jgi:hypothetical protein
VSDPNVMNWTEEDLIVLQDAGVELPWSLAPTLFFQNFIRRHGTPEKKSWPA